jgi:hypothetical protein
VIQTTGGGGGDPVFLETIHCKLPIIIYLLHTANNASAEDRDTERETQRERRELLVWVARFCTNTRLGKTKTLVSYGTIEEEV